MTDEVKQDETTEEVVAEEQTTEATEATQEATPAAAPAAEEEGEEVVVPAKFKEIVDAIDTMSVLDLHELVKLFEKKFGVSAAAVAQVGGPAAEAAEEKSSFDVELSSVGDSKIGVIKAVKAALGLGLKEAKELVDAAPSMLKTGMKKEDAEALKAEIEAAGGSVELK